MSSRKFRQLQRQAARIGRPSPAPRVVVLLTSLLLVGAGAYALVTPPSQPPECPRRAQRAADARAVAGVVLVALGLGVPLVAATQVR